MISYSPTCKISGSTPTRQQEEMPNTRHSAEGAVLKLPARRFHTQGKAFCSEHRARRPAQAGPMVLLQGNLQQPLKNQFL